MHFRLCCPPLFVAISLLLLPFCPNEAAGSPKRKKATANYELTLEIEDNACLLGGGDNKGKVIQVHRVQFDKDGWLGKLFRKGAEEIFLVETKVKMKTTDYRYKYTVLAAKKGAGKAGGKASAIADAADQCAKHAINKAHKAIVEHETPCILERISDADYICRLSSPVKYEAVGDVDGKKKMVTVNQLHLSVFRDDESLKDQKLPRCVFKEDHKGADGILKWAESGHWAFVIPDVENKLFVVIGEGIHRIDLKGLQCHAGSDYCLFQPLQCEFTMLHKTIPQFSATNTPAANTHTHDEKKSHTHDEKKQSQAKKTEGSETAGTGEKKVKVKGD